MNVYKKAIEKWGAVAQIFTFYEEIGELMTAINHYKRDRISKECLASEFADVTIMLEQMLILFDLTDMVKEAKDFKLKRLEALLNG